MERRIIRLDEYRLIEWHNRRLIEAADGEIIKFRKIPGPQRPDWVRKQLQYWVHVKAALEWSTNVAKQRLGKADNGERTTV